MNCKTWQHTLTADEIEARIRKLAREGWGDYQIAELFGVNVNQVRRVIGACEDCE